MKFSKITTILYILGAIFATSPFVLYWWIHGNYDRYLWIINQPYPLSHFGSGPFQLFLFAILFAVGIGLFTLGFLFRKDFGGWQRVCMRICIATGVALLSLLLVIGSVITWDNIARQQLNERNENCKLLMQELSQNGDSSALPPCAYEITPPSITELLLRKEQQTLSPNPCDRSATTSDCASITPKPLDGSVHDTQHRSEAFDLNIAYSKNVYLLDDKIDRLAFSLLPPDNPKQQSSVGLVNALVFTHYDTAPEDATPVTIGLYDNPYGIRALKSESVGAYGGELHRTYFFRDYGISASYVVKQDTETVFEAMIRSLQFNTIPEVTLTDGEETIGGTFHKSPSVNGMKSFRFDKFGISLQYPDDHLLFTGSSSISIAPEEKILDAIARIRTGAGGGEGPPGIYFTFFEVSNQFLSLEEWIRTDSRSNWKLALPSWEEQKNTLTPTTVADVPAFEYHNEGLYSYDYVAFEHGDWVVLASGASGSDTPNPNFQTVINSLQLNK